MIRVEKDGGWFVIVAQRRTRTRRMYMRPEELAELYRAIADLLPPSQIHPAPGELPVTASRRQ